MFARRAVVRAATLRAPQRRKFGAHSAEEAAEEMTKWKKVFFYVALPVSAVKGISDFFADHDHPHDEGPQPDYMKIRNKSYSWECEDCALFDGKCWEECRAEKANA